MRARAPPYPFPIPFPVLPRSTRAREGGPRASGATRERQAVSLLIAGTERGEECAFPPRLPRRTPREAVTVGRGCGTRRE